MEDICNGQQEIRVILAWMMKAIAKVLKKKGHKISEDSALAFCLNRILQVMAISRTSTKPQKPCNFCPPSDMCASIVSRVS